MKTSRLIQENANRERNILKVNLQIANERCNTLASEIDERQSDLEELMKMRLKVFLIIIEKRNKFEFCTEDGATNDGSRKS